MSLKTRLLCGFRFFLLKKTILDLVMHSILQVVAAFYASLQIRCTAHNLRLAGFTKYKITYQKGPTFSFAVYCCTHWVGWRSQRQSEKVNIRNACFLPVRAKCGRFCVLMNGRVFGHIRLSVFRTAATVHPPYWQNGGSYPPDLTVTDWLLVPANAKVGSAARSPLTSWSLAEGITGHTQSSSAAEFSGLCPPPSLEQENILPCGIVLTQTIQQKRQTRQCIVVTSSKSLSHNGFRISCFCDFYRNQVEITEFANGDSISIFKTTKIERNIPLWKIKTYISL